MTVGIIGSGEIDVNNIDDIMEGMLAESDVLLFNVACAGKNSLGAQYAEKRGLPITRVDTLDMLLKESNFILAVVGPGGDVNGVKNFMMRAKMAGKHGRMVVIE